MRELKEGDIVNVDVSVYIGGYHGDLNEVGARKRAVVLGGNVASKGDQGMACFLRVPPVFRGSAAPIDAPGFDCSGVLLPKDPPAEPLLCRGGTSDMRHMDARNLGAKLSRRSSKQAANFIRRSVGSAKTVFVFHEVVEVAATRLGR